MRIAEAAVWLTAGILVYTYFGYPLLLLVWARLRPRRAEPPRNAPLPHVTVIIVAYNEEKLIARKLANILNLDYPASHREIIVGCDGATDETATRARQFVSRGVRVIEFTRRRGKSRALNDLVSRARGDIVVFADTRQRFARSALRYLVAGFEDPHIGAVSGELVLVRPSETSHVGGGSGFYWRYETLLRRLESDVDSTVGVTGPIYAVRRQLFRPLPPTLLDDVLTPLNIVRQGYRVLYEPRAVAYEPVIQTARAEFSRKTRTIAGSYQLLIGHPWVIMPGMNRLWFQTFSHKGCRLLGPPCLATVFCASLLLSSLPAYRFLLGAQLAFYTAAATGRILRNTRIRAAPLNVAYVFCLFNWATVVALFKVIRAAGQATWEPTRG